jgi:hypothetical protein
LERHLSGLLCGDFGILTEKNEKRQTSQLRLPLAAKELHAGATAAGLSGVSHTVLDDSSVAIIFERLQPDAVTRYARHAALLILAKFSGPPSEFSTLPSGQTVRCHPFGSSADSGRQKTACVIESTTPPFGSTIAPVQACE